VRFAIEHHWDGRVADPADHTYVDLSLGESFIEVRVDAPFSGDPAPAKPAGRVDGLWRYEVVELFLLGSAERYLEIELGPHGHHLLLKLRGQRVVVDEPCPVDYTAQLRDGRWVGHARLARDVAPDPIERANAYAIRGEGGERRYLAWRPVPGPAPDFHRLACFGVLPEQSL
jgi:hypothetical protein